MHRLWILFSQIVTATLAAIFVVSLVKPEWLPWRGKDVIAVREAPAPLVLPASNNAAARQVTFSDAARKAIPSVVNISSSKQVQFPRNDPRANPEFRRFWGLPEPQAQRSLGSGVLVSKEGYLLTNNHVVDGASQIEIYLADGRTLPAQLVGSDRETDLAVLKVTAPNLVPITFSASDAIRVGDVVLAIGDPFGVGQTVTMGIVSALGKRGIGDSDVVDFIQTDAAINPGNSGGALVDSQGNLIGINSMIYSESGGSQGIGFAIPSLLARGVMEQLIETGTVRRGYFGVSYSALDEEIARALALGDARGLLIRNVKVSSPADKAGIRPGDVLLSIGGVAVPDTLTANRTIYALPPGQKAAVQVQRGSERLTLSITVGERPAAPLRKG
jgi:serine protease DegQ